MTFRSIAFLLAALVSAPGATAEAARRDVLLVVNAAEPTAAAIADAYPKVHDIPAAQTVTLNLPPQEAVSRADYERRIAAPVTAWLRRNGAEDEITYIVLIRGVPLIVKADAKARTPLLGVDASLSALYRTLAGGTPMAGPAANPYYTERPHAEAGWPGFDRRRHDIYLVSRLDGWTSEDALSLAGRCTALPAGSVLRVVLDDRERSQAVEQAWFQEAATRVLGAGVAGLTIDVDDTAEASPARDDVIGYFAWGASDPAQRRRTVDMRFRPGAIGGSLSASDTRTLVAPPDGWTPAAHAARAQHYSGSGDWLAGDFIRAGITGWVGAVADPNVDGLARPHVFLPAYLAGRSLGEAYYLSMKYVGGRNVVFGDPLCRPFGAEPAAPTFTRDDRSGLTGPILSRLTQAARLESPGSPLASVEARIAAQAWMARGERSRGLGILEARLAESASDLATLQLLALHLDPATERERAVQVYRAILALRPSDVLAGNNLAYALASDAGSREEALALARRAHEISRGEPVVADTYGWVLYQAGQLPQAIQILREALRRAPDFVEARIHLALAQLAGGSLPDARASWLEALKRDPGAGERPEAAPLVQSFGTAPTP